MENNLNTDNLLDLAYDTINEYIMTFVGSNEQEDKDFLEQLNIEKQLILSGDEQTIQKVINVYLPMIKRG